MARSAGLKRVLPAGALGSSWYEAPDRPAPKTPGAVAPRTPRPEPLAALRAQATPPSDTARTSPQKRAAGPVEQADIFPQGMGRFHRRAHTSAEPVGPAPGAARFYRRPLVVALALVVVTAGLGGTVAWGRGEAIALGQRTRQLAAVESTLASTRASLNTQGHSSISLQVDLRHATAQWATVKAQLANGEEELAKTEGELNQAQGQLTLAQSRAGQAQSRAGQAQNRAGQAQSQLGHTQVKLTTTQSHAATCQQGASLGQQTVQLLATLIFLENAYLTAAASKDTSQMQGDLSQMRALDAQVQALGPKFSASVQLCTTGQ